MAWIKTQKRYVHRDKDVTSFTTALNWIAKKANRSECCRILNFLLIHAAYMQLVRKGISKQKFAINILRETLNTAVKSEEQEWA